MEIDKRRKANFTESEKVALIEEIRAKEHILRPKFNSTVTHQEKEKAWAEIALKLNAINPGAKRTVAEVKKKWHNLTSVMKENMHSEKRAMERTGAGPSTSVLTDIDSQILAIIGEETPAIAGIKDAPNSLSSIESSSDSGSNSAAGSSIIVDDGDVHKTSSRLRRPPKRAAEGSLYEVYLEKEIERSTLSCQKIREEMSKIALEKELITLKIKKMKKEMDVPIKQEVFDLTCFSEM